MNQTPHAPAQALDTPQPEAATRRFGVILRGADGRGELLGQLHQTQQAAESMAGYWQSHYCGTVQAEVVGFEIPMAGKPIAEARDLFTPESEEAHG